jgi:glycosyltransferase involved in cell wall biosynthesis
MPKVSVIIPAFNSLKYLPSTLESVFQQTFSDYEVIIVDDGSTDGTTDWGLNLEYPNVQFLFQENQGSASARNAGLSKANGEYIAFLDADDIWASSKLAKQVNVLDQFPEVGLVYSWVGSINSAGEIRGKVRRNIAEGNVWEVIALGDIVECGSAPLVRRSGFEEVGVFDVSLSYAQVWDMWMRIASHYPFKVIQEVLIYYRDHPENYSKNWHRIEPNYQKIIEKNFSNVSPQLIPLKKEAYAHAYLRIAWKVFQSEKRFTRDVKRYIDKSLESSSKILFTSQYFRLKVALVLVSMLGFDRYNNLRMISHTAKALVLKD